MTKHFVATEPFNVHGVIAEKKGQKLEIKDDTIAINLLNIGLIQKSESKVESKDQPKPKAKAKSKSKAKKK